MLVALYRNNTAVGVTIRYVGSHIFLHVLIFCFLLAVEGGYNIACGVYLIILVYIHAENDLFITNSLLFAIFIN